jgi:ATP-binding cassette, subfamily B, multidrug efflux pump
MKHLLRLGSLLRPYWFQIVLSLLILAILTAIALTIPSLIRVIIDQGITEGEYQLLIQAALILLGLGIVRSSLNYSQRYISEWIASHIGFDLRNLLYNHIQNLPFSYHDHTQSGQLISRCIEDVRAIERFAGFGVVELIRVTIYMVTIPIILFVQSPLLAFIAILPLIPLVLITLSFGKKIGRYFYAVDNALGDLSAHLQENVTGAQVVRAFARENFEKSRFSEKNRTLYKARLVSLNQWSRIMPTTNFLVALSTILIILFGGFQVISGELTVGQVVAFNGYLLLLAGPAQQLAWMVNAAGEADAGAQRTQEILDLKPAIATPENAYHLPVLSGKVEFLDVSFAYTTGSPAALQDIQLSVKPNQLIALIGPTGSGKTSLVSLIPRFYDVSAGTVLIDDQDVRSVDLVSLRKQIGIVLQTSLLFSTTIKDNIAYGRPDASLDEIVAAAKSAQAHEFIQELADGYETVVGERGITLSGGQRQRVAIARALLLDPRILILDDSTSSVDTETERLIQEALDHLMLGRTTFVIAHRLSTVRRADLILVMDHGKIVERGSHAELLLQKGLYREIYNLQLRDQEKFQEDMVTLQVDQVQPYQASADEKDESDK